MRTIDGVRIAAAALVAVTGCGSSGGQGTRPTPTQSLSPTPSPTPTLPTVAADAASVKKAVVTAADLGTPWVQPKVVNQAAGATGELCPGQDNARTIAKPRAQAQRKLTHGTKPTADIGSFSVRTYAFGQEQKWRDAFTAADRGCASWKSAEGAYVELETIATPPTVAGADEVMAHIERVYADKSKKTLYYVRHFYEARVGRVVVSFELAYVQPKSDPTGKDMTRSAALLAKQVAKAKATFGL